MGVFRSLCAREKMQELQWPQRDYFVQVARFDPSKGKHSKTADFIVVNVLHRYTQRHRFLCQVPGPPFEAVSGAYRR